MNLPNFDPIQTVPERSTYYAFSKAMKDLDKAITENKVWYFTKMVALNLPLWNASEMFFRFRKSTSTPAGDITNYSENPEIGNFPELEVDNYINPNVVIPNMFKYYLENIIRQTNVSNNGHDTVSQEYIAEVAFWRTLNKMGISNDEIYGLNGQDSIVTYANTLHTASFTDVSNNHGWCEILGGIPNQCPLLKVDQSSWKIISNIDNVISADENNDHGIYDDGDSSFSFDLSGNKRVLNFDALTYDTETVQEFDFNTLLLFYTDSTGIQKLHGVDFIFPFKETMNGWGQEKVKHWSNNLQSFGYSFKFNMKSCNNAASKSEVYEINEETFYDVYEESLSNFNSFLELQKQRGEII